MVGGLAGADAAAERSPRIAAGSRLLVGAEARATGGSGVGDGTVAGAAGGTLGAGSDATGGTGAGRIGVLPASGLFGSQFLFFCASAASCSALRCGTLLMKGTGTLVT